MLDGIGILIELGESKEEQKRFFNLYSKCLKPEFNIVKRYERERDKFAFYYEEENLQDIEEYYKGAKEEQEKVQLLEKRINEIEQLEPTEATLAYREECLKKRENSQEKYTIYCEFLREEYFLLERKIAEKMNYEIEKAKQYRFEKRKN